MADRKQELRDDLVQARDEALAAVSGLPTEQLERASVNEAWTAKDLLAHLSSIEARLQSMCQHALDGEKWPPDDRSVDAYNARCVEERRPWPAEKLVDELRTSGERTLSFLDQLAPADLDR